MLRWLSDRRWPHDIKEEGTENAAEAVEGLGVGEAPAAEITVGAGQRIVVVIVGDQSTLEFPHKSEEE